MGLKNAMMSMLHIGTFQLIPIKTQTILKLFFMIKLANLNVFTIFIFGILTYNITFLKHCFKRDRHLEG